MALGNCILLGINDIETVTASTEVGDFVAANLINTQPSEIWRALTLTEQTIRGKLTSLKRISGFALSNHNLLDETVRLQLSLDPDQQNIVFDQTWVAREPDYGWGEGTWGNLDATFGGYAIDGGGLSTQLIQTFDAVAALYYRVIISNISTRIPEAGTLYLGSAFRPVKNVMRDPSIPVIDPSEITLTRGQGMRSNNLRTFREIQLRWHALTTDEAHQFRRICRLTGRRGLMVLSMRPGADGLDEIENKMVCRLVDWEGPSFRGDSITDRYIVSATFREAL